MSYLQGKTLLITGVSRGIGRALAEQALEAGMTVVGWGKTAPDYGDGKLRFQSCDITDSESVSRAAAELEASGLRPDFLVNNAGFGFFSPIQDFEEDVFRRMWEVNVFGAFLVTKALVKGMQEKQSGHIVNISSIAGRVGAPWGTGYNSSKFAMGGMGESLFHELRKQGIKVTNVYPGSTATHFFDEIPGMTPHANMLDPREVARTILHVLDTSPNFLIREIEMRPLKSKPK